MTCAYHEGGDVQRLGHSVIASGEEERDPVRPRRVGDLEDERGQWKSGRYGGDVEGRWTEFDATGLDGVTKGIRTAEHT